MKKLFQISLLITLLLVGKNSIKAQITNSPKREFRGVWIASVANIDWPSKSGLPTDQQKQELIDILNKHKEQGINAIMFQVRPATDALYAKSNEPWSQWLTGTQGQAPSPFYDPLEFAIEECHKRGMEIHAWFNPYRAVFDNVKSSIAANHITNQKPEWFFNYGGKKIFDPGIPEVREYITSVILNVVNNYNIDGVHLDDYFYPYGVKGQIINDNKSFAKYNDGFTDIKDWRRYNVDLLIKMINDSVHHHKKHVKFGVSPFGIWKNKGQDIEGSETRGGDSYYGNYADSRKWVKEGWVDYINPQIYWSFASAPAPYAKLVDWWSDNSYNRHLYIGHGAYRINTKKDLAWANPKQIPDQITYNRANPRVQGSIYFSSKSLTNNILGVGDSLATNYYKYPALPPLMLWLDSVPPNKPETLLAVQKENNILLSWEKPLAATDGDKAYGYVVYRFEEGNPIDINDPSTIKNIYYGNITSWEDNTIEKGKTYTYLVTALDRSKNESAHSNPVTLLVK